jgi:hypothetical protein
MELEKPQPEQVVIDVVTELKWEPPIAAPELKEEELKEEEARETAEEASAHAQPDDAQADNVQADNAQVIIERSREQEELPPGTIQACHRPLKRELEEAKTAISARRQVPEQVRKQVRNKVLFSRRGKAN